MQTILSVSESISDQGKLCTAFEKTRILEDMGSKGYCKELFVTIVMNTSVHSFFSRGELKYGCISKFFDIQAIIKQNDIQRSAL